MVKFEVDIDQSELQSEIKRKTAAIKDTLIGLKKANAVKRARAGQEYVLKSLPTLHPFNKLLNGAVIKSAKLTVEYENLGVVGVSWPSKVDGADQKTKWLVIV